MRRAFRERLGNAVHDPAGRRARRAIAELMSGSSTVLRSIGTAMSETANRQGSTDEFGLVARIENRRRSLLESKSVIDVVDYGAGSPNSNRTGVEMSTGVNLTMPVSKVCNASKSAFWGFFLFKLVRHLAPRSCLELGTCVGISGAYLGTGLKLNGQGKLVTLEGSPKIADVARETFECVGLTNTVVSVGPFQDTYADALKSIEPVEFLFNDGHHDHDALLRYYYDALPYIGENSVMLFDDISWSDGMQKAWQTVCRDKNVSATIDLNTMGIAVLSRRECSEKQAFSIPF